MRTFLTWSDKVHDREGVKQPIYDLAFKPDGSQIIAAAGAEVLVYDTTEGDLIQSLKAHKDTVYAVDFSADGSRFASGGADKQVIIWNAKMEGILKYSHNDSIQCISHNPVTGQVVSCTASDFGLWSSEQKTVTKHKVPARILTASWTNDGQYFALGLYNGNISIRNRTGEEKVRIERGTSPIWSLQWSPTADSDLLAVTDWSQRLSFFQLSGRQVGKDRHLNYDPCSVSFFSGGDYVAVGGSDKKVTLWTSEGIKLGPICDREGWVWCCKVKPKQNYVAVGCNDGTIALYQIVFNTVHGLYNDRYAYRENMTDVVIQHLSTDQRARIKCRDYVKKIAVFRDRLAVQLPDRVIIYELFHDDATDMHYRIKEKLQKRLDCNLLVVTSNHIILCLENKLQMYHFSGEKEREWNLEALIRYIKVTGGPNGREGLLVGLKNGQIFQIFIDNPFPIPLIKQQTSVRCLDLSLSRTRLAVVDEHNTCLVYDLRTKELVFQEPNANSVAWNTELEDMLCYSGNGILNIKVGNFPAHQQKMQGFVVGFKGSKIFCLHVYAMTTVDVPQSASLDRYLEKKEHQKAYEVACLGVTEGDWRRLATDALEGLNISVAGKAFTKLKDLRFIELIETLEKMKADGKNESDLFLGLIHAYNGKFHEASKLFKRSGHPQKAIEMYTELNMWEYATQLADETNGDKSAILKRKAQIQQDRNDILSAATTYIEVGDHLQAINILGPAAATTPIAMEKLSEISRKLTKADSKCLARCVFYFRKYNQHALAAECLMKMGDMTRLLALYVELQQWEDAFRIAEAHPALAPQIYLPYAQWLAINDRYMEAQINYRKAGRLDEAVRVLEQLAKNAVIECRYEDAAYLYWMLGQEKLEALPNDIDDYLALTEAQRELLRSYKHYDELAELYFAYNPIKRFIDDPFTSHLSESLHNMARFILHRLSGKNHSDNWIGASYGATGGQKQLALSQIQRQRPMPAGMSKAYILYALAKLSRTLGANKLARSLFERLQHLNLPFDWREQVDAATLTSRGRTPNTDREDLLTVCFSCSTVNPLLNASALGGGGVGGTASKAGDGCIGCLEPFVRSFYSFEALPLVQFLPEDGITDEEAEAIINAEPPINGSYGSEKRPATAGGRKASKKSSKSNGGGSGVLGQSDDGDLSRQLAGLERSAVAGSEGGEFVPMTVDRQGLQAMNRREVFIRKFGAKKCIRWQFFRLTSPDTPLVMCESCHHFFLDDEWNYQYLQKGCCHFCRRAASNPE